MIVGHKQVNFLRAMFHKSESTRRIEGHSRNNLGSYVIVSYTEISPPLLSRSPIQQCEYIGFTRVAVYKVAVTIGLPTGTMVSPTG